MNRMNRTIEEIEKEWNKAQREALVNEALYDFRKRSEEPIAGRARSLLLCAILGVSSAVCLKKGDLYTGVPALLMSTKFFIDTLTNREDFNVNVVSDTITFISCGVLTCNFIEKANAFSGIVFALWCGNSFNSARRNFLASKEIKGEDLFASKKPKEKNLQQTEDCE